MMFCVANVIAYNIVGIIRFGYQVVGIYIDLGNINGICVLDFISSVYWLIFFYFQGVGIGIRFN